jgi:uncharacterized protein YhaN
MRIDELHLKAFGPFTDTVLDFAKGSEGLHLVYGSNEAGKSSALRALRNMLYGIPARTPDNFVHSYAKMRIGAIVRLAAGESLNLIRRKGRDHTLRRADDESIIDEKVLSQLIKGIDADLFFTMFGIGYDDLVRGGQEIIRGGGNLGRLIFSAGSGIANLQGVQDELQADADALFRPSAQKPVINALVQQFKSHQASLRNAQLPGQDWELHQQSLERALEQKTEVESRLAALEKSRGRLKRIKEALPIIARRNEIKEELADGGSVPDLPEDFSDKRQTLIMELSIAEKEKKRTAETIAINEKAAAELNVSSRLLGNADLIEEMYQELGSHRKAAKDCINLETRKDTLQGEALELLRMLQDEVTLEEAEKLRIKKDQVVLIQELSGQYERIITRKEDLRDRLPDIEQALNQRKAEFNSLPSPLPTQALKASLSEAEAYGPLEIQMHEKEAEIQATLRSLENERHRLGLSDRPIDMVESLSVPNMETLRLFEARFDTLAQSATETEKEIDRSQTLLRDDQRQMEANRLALDVPSEDDLVRIRNKRDQGLDLVAKKLNMAEVPAEALEKYLDELPQADSLMEVVSYHVKQADDVSDRLRREADRVAVNARLMSDIEDNKERIAKFKKKTASFAEQRKDLLGEWEHLWQVSGINPRTPKEMSQWLQAFTSLVDKLKEVRSRQIKVDRLAKDIDSHRQLLIQSLQSMPHHQMVTDEASLARLIALTAQVVEEQDQLAQQRGDLIREKKRLEKELAAASSKMELNEERLDQWQNKWELAVRPIGLMAETMPSQALAVLEDLKILFDKIKEADILQKRIQGIHRDEAAFDDRVDQLLERTAPDLKGQPSNEAVIELQNRLKQSRDARAKQQTFEKQVIKERQRNLQAKEKIADIQAALNQMCKEASCNHYTELAEVEKLSNRRRNLKTELKNAEDRLRMLSGGDTVDAFAREARRVDPDTLSSEIDVLGKKIEDTSSEKSKLDNIIGREENELEKMDGSAKAALIAEEIQFLSGNIANAVERYAGLKIAAKVLSTAIERYRDKSQGPILECASRLFEQITSGSFKALRAEYDSGGLPVLVGVRKGSGDIVGVDGMSDGTADQLYLALRLAGLETYLENNEPIPFIVDDILIKFDNERAVATLQVLAELSQKTQVIFFTHHRHLVELAETYLDDSVLYQQELQ